MDPASIIGLTGNVVQALAYGYDLVSGAREIYRSEQGATDDISRMRVIVEDIRRSVKSIDLDLVSEDLSQDVAHLKLIAEECEKAAEHILREISSVQSRKTGWARKFDSVRKAGLTAWKKKDIAELLSRLLSLESRLNGWWAKWASV